jgi:hypothetical protein
MTVLTEKCVTRTGLKVNAIEAWIRCQYLQAYPIGQASRIFTTLTYPAGMYTEFAGTGRIDESNLSISHPDSAIAQHPWGSDVLILKQVQASPAFSLNQYDDLSAMAITTPEGDE